MNSYTLKLSRGGLKPYARPPGGVAVGGVHKLRSFQLISRQLLPYAAPGSLPAGPDRSDGRTSLRTLSTLCAILPTILLTTLL